MSTDGPALSVVVTTYNRRNRVISLLEALLEQPAAYEIVVVVDGAGDGTADAVGHLTRRDPRVRLVPLPGNSGPHRARTAGVLAAAGEIVLFLDDDVVVTAGLVAGHRQRHLERRGRVVLGYMPTVLPERRRRGQFATYFYAETYEEHVRAYERDPAEVFRRFWSGNFSVHRRDFLDALQGVDFPARYHEDRHLGRCFLEAGLEPVFDRSLCAVHCHQRSLREYIREGHSAGHGQYWLRVLHPDGPDQASLVDGEAEVRPHTALVLALGALPGVRQLVRAVLFAAVKAAGLVHLFSVESRSAWLLKELDRRRAIQFLSGRDRKAG